jgi:hypothetical protein
MTRRGWLLLGAVIFVCGTAFSFWVTRPSPGLTPDNCMRVFKGMTVGQIEAILGPMHQKQLSRAQVPEHWFGGWENEAISVEICFSMGDTVEFGSWEYPINEVSWIHHDFPAQPTLWEKIRTWMKTLSD